MITVFWLTEQQFERLRPLLPTENMCSSFDANTLAAAKFTVLIHICSSPARLLPAGGAFSAANAPPCD